MQISLNGKPYILENILTVGEFVQILALEPTQVAIEKNREIVPKSCYASEMIKDGDEIEIVAFIGGG